MDQIFLFLFENRSVFAVFSLAFPPKWSWWSSDLRKAPNAVHFVTLPTFCSFDCTNFGPILLTLPSESQTNYLNPIIHQHKCENQPRFLSRSSLRLCKNLFFFSLRLEPQKDWKSILLFCSYLHIYLGVRSFPFSTSFIKCSVNFFQIRFFFWDFIMNLQKSSKRKSQKSIYFVDKPWVLM